MDHSLHGIPVIFIIIISACYAIFACQVIYQTMKSGTGFFGSDVSKALVALVAVFTLCMLSGYLSKLFPEDWWPLRWGFHFFLTGASIWLVVTNQARFIVQAMRDLK